MKASLNIVKVGGKVVEDDSSLNSLLTAFCSIKGNKILVTGGGRTATKMASELGIESLMIDGRRITDEPMLRIVTMVYAGLVSKNVVAELQARGITPLVCAAPTWIWSDAPDVPPGRLIMDLSGTWLPSTRKLSAR